MLLKPFKIKVESKSHSREIQEWLFSLGYGWWSRLSEPVQEVKYLDAKYIFSSKVFIDCDLTFSARNNPEFFESLEVPEMWFYDGKLQDKPQTSLPKEEVSMNNIKTYREVAEAFLAGVELQSLDYSGIAESSRRWVPFTYLGFDISLLDEQYPRKIRVKPRYCNGVELDPCLTKYPETGSYYYYYPDPMHVDFYNIKLWTGYADDVYWFKLGFAYATSESAAKHGQAMGRYM